MSDENKTPEEQAAETVAGELNPDDWQEGTPEPVEQAGAVDLAAAKPEHVDVTCAGCNNTFGFDIDSKTEGFTFQCTVCRTQTAWTRA